MKFAACFIFILILVFCLWYGDNTRIWGGLFIINLYLLGWFAFWELSKIWIKMNKLIAIFIQYICLFQALYTATCMILGPEWVMSNRVNVAWLVLVGLGSLIAHIIINQIKK